MPALLVPDPCSEIYQHTYQYRPSPMFMTNLGFSGCVAGDGQRGRRDGRDCEPAPPGTDMVGGRCFPGMEAVMGIGVSLFLIAVGAILTFALHLHHIGG